MPRKKDSAADKKLKAAQRASTEVTVKTDYTPRCQMDNILVQEEWNRFVPPLIKVKIANIFTEGLFTELCYINVILRQMQGETVDGNTPWFEKVQNYGDGGTPIDGVKESGQLKAVRQWSARRENIMKTLGLTPKEMMGLFNFGQGDSDDEDMFT